MQKRLIKDTKAEIAKKVYAFGESENIKIYMDEEEKCFNQKEVKIEVFRRQFQHWFFDAAEILKENLQAHRLIHKKNWKLQIKNILSK